MSIRQTSIFMDKKQIFDLNLDLNVFAWTHKPYTISLTTTTKLSDMSNGKVNHSDKLIKEIKFIAFLQIKFR